MNLRVFYLTRRGISDGYVSSRRAVVPSRRSVVTSRLRFFILLSQVAAVCTYGMSII